MRSWLNEPMIHVLALVRHANKKQDQHDRTVILQQKTAQIRAKQQSQLDHLQGLS